jgi:ligand-binding SRPBCC domain-containing protein
MLYSLQTKQFIKSDMETVWLFISSPINLSVITPSQMGFDIISKKEDAEKMYAGQIIEYFVKPILGIKMYWATEITHVRYLEYFVDEQRVGPYKIWHHQHFINKVEGGVEMADIVHYKPPFGIFGKMANFLFIKRQLKTIFHYRFNKINEIFNQEYVKPSFDSNSLR